MSRVNWVAVMDQSEPWKVCYPIVEREAKDALDHTTEVIDTATLVEWLFPAELAQGNSWLSRQRIFKALAALARHGLADYVTLDSPTPGKFGMMQRRKLWHAAKAPEPPKETFCSHYGIAVQANELI